MPNQRLATQQLAPVEECRGVIDGLIRRCAAGDENALEVLVDRLHPFVLSIVSEGVSLATAETLQVETFRRVWRGAPSYDSSQTSIGWVVGHARAAAGLPVPGREELSGAAMDRAERLGLSSREFAIITLIATGLTNQEVAQRIYVSINTVKSYIRSAYRKISAESRSQAVIWAFDNGLVTPSPAPDHLPGQPLAATAREPVDLRLDLVGRTAASARGA